jgi:hypothetical protein
MAKATSRRGFLGRIARLAGGAAFALAGLAAGTANAANRETLKGPPYKDGETVCIYWCPNGRFISKRGKSACKTSWKGCLLVDSY